MERLQQKQINVNYFYSLLNEFMDEIIDVFPEERVRIEKYRMLTNTARKANYMSPIRVFYEAVRPYKKHIETCDDSYFLDDNKIKEITEGDEETLVEGLALKQLWCHKDTTIDIKAAIWCYLQQLLQCAGDLC